MKVAIITGASSGMGQEFLFQLLEEKSQLEEIWMIARRSDRLMDIKKQVTRVKIKCISLDLTKEEELEAFQKQLREERPEVKYLVNAAGCGFIGEFREVPYEKNQTMVRLNCEALMAVTYCVLPYMQAGGRIYQFASSAAFLPQPGFAIYAATKSFVLSFSRALNQELKKKKIHVLAICPGPVKTEFFDIATTTGEIKFYKKLFMADSKKVVRKAIKDGKRKKQVSVYSGSMKLFLLISKIIPHGVLMKFVK